jgi:hypothetical protein
VVLGGKRDKRRIWDGSKVLYLNLRNASISEVVCMVVKEGNDRFMIYQTIRKKDVLMSVLSWHQIAV